MHSPFTPPPPRATAGVGGPGGLGGKSKTAFFSKLNDRSFVIPPEKSPPGTAVRVNQNKNDDPAGLMVEIYGD